MLIVMGAQASAEDVARVCRKIEELGFKAHPMPGASRTAIGLTGNSGPVEPGFFENMPGVVDLIEVTHPYKLISREIKPDNTRITIREVVIGGDDHLTNCYSRIVRFDLTAYELVRMRDLDQIHNPGHVLEKARLDRTGVSGQSDRGAAGARHWMGFKP